MRWWRTDEARKETRPDIDRSDVVFSEGRASWVSAKNSKYDSETASITAQIKNSQNILNSMDIIGEANAPQNFKDKYEAGQWAIEQLKVFGYQVDRQHFGKIFFSEQDIKYGLNYADTDAEKAALILIPKVLKRGIQIGHHGNHKLRQKETITFAGPVLLNGIRGNMAVVVNMHGNKYSVHRIILPDGTAFKFSKKNNEVKQESYQGVTGNSSLADTTSFTSNSSISNSTENVKQKQLEIIEKVNPAPNTYSTWVRSVEDIKTLSETLEDSEWADYDEFNPDLSRDMIEEAIESGKITVYSSYPIKQGVFVSPSYMEAESYSGDGKVYEKTVNIQDVAWIDPTQGMYAKTESENLEKINEILYNKKSPLSIVNRAKTFNNSSLGWVYKSEIFSVEESKLFHDEISRINQNSGALDYSKNTAGEYMIPVGNKIVFTDGDYEYPYVREVIEVLTEYATEFEDIKRCIFNVEKGKSEKQDEARYVQNTFGKGRIVSYTSRDNGVYGWENGRRKGRTRKEVIGNYLNKQFGKGNDRKSREAQINKTAPIKEASSEDGAIFNSDFEPDTERNGFEFDYAQELLENPNNIELKIRRRQPNESATGEKHPNTFKELSSSNNSISNSADNVNKKDRGLEARECRKRRSPKLSLCQYQYIRFCKKCQPSP